MITLLRLRFSYQTVMRLPTAGDNLGPGGGAALCRSADAAAPARERPGGSCTFRGGAPGGYKAIERGASWQTVEPAKILPMLRAASRAAKISDVTPPDTLPHTLRKRHSDASRQSIQCASARQVSLWPKVVQAASESVDPHALLRQPCSSPQKCLPPSYFQGGPDGQTWRSSQMTQASCGTLYIA